MRSLTTAIKKYLQFFRAAIMRLWGALGHHHITIRVAELPQHAGFIEQSSHVANWTLIAADTTGVSWQPWIKKLNHNVITKFITIAIELPVIDTAVVATYSAAINHLLNEIQVPVSRILLYLQLPEILERSLSILPVPDSMGLADAHHYLYAHLQQLSAKIDHVSDSNILAQTWCCYGMLQQIVAGLASIQTHTPLLQQRFIAHTQVVITRSAYTVYVESLKNYPRYQRKSWYQLAVCILLLIGSMAYVMHANADYRSFSENITERAHLLQKLVSEDQQNVKTDVLASEIDALERSKRALQLYPLQLLYLRKYINPAVQHIWQVTIEPQVVQKIEHELMHLSLLHAAWYQYALVYIHLAKQSLTKNVIEFAGPVVGQTELELLAQSQLHNTSLLFNKKILADTMRTFTALPRWSKVYFLYQTKVNAMLPEAIEHIHYVFPSDHEIYSGAMLQRLPTLTEIEAKKLLQESFALDPYDLHRTTLSTITLNAMLQQQYLTIVKKIQQVLNTGMMPDEQSAMLHQQSVVTELRQFSMMAPKPLNSWLQQLLLQIDRLLQKKYANTLRNDLRHSLDTITKQFPLMKTSKVSVDQDTLKNLFGEQGQVTQLLRGCDSPLSYTSYYCKLQPIASEIRQVIQPVTLRFTTDYLARNVSQCRLQINDDLIINDHGPQQMSKLVLSSFAENAVINLTIEYDHGPATQRNYRGPWAIYRLLHDAQVEQTQQTQIRLSWGNAMKRCDFLLDSTLPVRLLRGTAFNDIATFIK